jgi:uncharacterized phage protein gp47/JayE
MPSTELPGSLRIYTRAERKEKYLRDYRLRNPDAQTGPDTEVDIDAATFADQAMIEGYNAQVIANGTTDQNSSGEWLAQRGVEAGVDIGEATGASGFVTIQASTGGGLINEGRELKPKGSQLRFKCLVTNVYADGDEVSIGGIDVGVATNIDAGTVMIWTNPPDGIYPTAVVFEQSDGSGLTGGRERQTEPEYRDTIADRRANPPASGNDAEYQKAARKTPGIGIQQAFTWPAIAGPGTTGVGVVLRPARPGATRVPNETQRALVEAHLKAQFPGDDGIFLIEFLEQPVAVVLKATWSVNASGWADTQPWPVYLTPTVRVKSTPAPTATVFTLYTITGATDPIAGQTIGLYNRSTGLFVRKRILSVVTTIAGPETRWAITCETTNSASDTSYTPIAEQLISPWSDSLDTMTPDVNTYIDGLGPGEMVAVFYDPGTRQKRQPESPGAWPHQITTRVLAPLFKLPSISSVVLVEPTDPYETEVGVPGVEAFLLTLGDLAVLPQ